MKKLLALAAVLAVFASVSSAQNLSLKNFKFFGEGQIFGANNTSKGAIISPAVNNQGDINVFSVLGLTFDVADNIGATVALGYGSTWGAQSLDGDNLNGYLNTIRVVQANLTVNKFADIDGLSATFGRQFYGEEDSFSAYFGVRRLNGDQIEAITSLDAVTVGYKKDGISAKAIYGQLDNADHSVYGLDVKISSIAEGVDAQIYVYDVNNDYANNAPTHDAREYVYAGIKPTVKINDLTIAVEFAKSFAGYKAFSTDVADYSSMIIKADLGYSADDFGARLTYFSLLEKNKDFLSFGNYNPGLIGANDLVQVFNSLNLIGYKNVQILNVGFDYALNKQLGLSIDYLHYTQALEFDDANGELDLTANYALSDNVSLFGGVGTWIASDIDFFEINTLQAGLNYKF
ncbi:hypothetical protein [Endomicrobium proavitum]|uniref:Uncharacterized protein n=1 Tax=Endomicrobium proavitum TaxID=1408281 RepID=A0A0G3WIC3_9BACT|nr:hypothetical protein [Endomicrobium proavitum]AKL97617.1 exported protein of unknown function [Endomicrobium proavitum]